MKSSIPKSPRAANTNAAISLNLPVARRTYSSIELEPGHDRLMRRPEVQRVTGLSRSSQYRLIAEGDFPSPIRLSANTVGWLASEVDAWVARRVAASRNKAAGLPPGSQS